jgi:hypothetical protein
MKVAHLGDLSDLKGENRMTENEATAEVFWTAFKGLPRIGRRAVLQRILKDKNLRRDLMDLAIIANRRSEPVRPLRAYLKDIKTGK